MNDFSDPLAPQISAEEVKKSLDEGEKVILLDVRTAGEYAKYKIGGSLNLPVDEVSGKIAALLPDKEAKIYVYCLSGSRSVIAVMVLKNLGYKNVFNLTSGLLAWRAKGFPVVS